MTPLSEVLQAYGQAWCEPDGDARRTLLVTAWANDGYYCDPQGEARGRDSLVAHIGGFHQAMPGARIEITSGVDTHHDRLRFAWRLVGADGGVVVEGIDVGRLAEDGRLSEIIGFFSPTPPAA